MRDRAYFFGSYQRRREKNGVSLINSSTTPLIPAGLTDTNRTAAGLSATIGVLLANINSLSLVILNARLPNGQFAIPSSGATGLAANAAVNVPQSGISRFGENQFNANGDFIVSDSHNISAKFFLADNPTFQENYNFIGLGNGECQLVGFGGDLTSFPVRQHEEFKKSLNVGRGIVRLQTSKKEISIDLKERFSDVLPNLQLLKDAFGGNIRFATSGAPLPEEIAEFFAACDLPIHQA